MNGDYVARNHPILYPGEEWSQAALSASSMFGLASQACLCLWTNL